MQIFITGIAGFLGSHLAERMLHLENEAMDMKDSPMWFPIIPGAICLNRTFQGYSKSASFGK
ncbi:hypothetical protein [Candidatus Cardinium hertigii]|uniref:hypothetical protein n=1 Tax=Candidatus Cardinium hertigii TaxID=247481 RepID=UPI000D707CD2|nr:hypothetical protein [Candidatus Cardinium hertigii]